MRAFAHTARCAELDRAPRHCDRERSRSIGQQIAFAARRNGAIFTGMDNEHEIAAIAQWVGQHRGQDAERYVAEQVTRMARRGDEDSARLWRRVAAHIQLPDRQIAHA